MNGFLAVNGFARATPWLHAPLLLFARYGVVVFAAVLVGSWWMARHRLASMAAALWAPVGVLLAVGLNQPLVNLVQEARPYQRYPQALLLVARSHDFSFPSDHAVMAGAATVGVLLAHPRLGVLTGAGALMMAFARVYVGAHYPHDVLAGLAFGAAVALLGFWLFRGPVGRLVRWVADTPLRPLLTRHPASDPR